MEIEHQIKRGNDPKKRELAGTIEKERADAQQQLVQQLKNEGALLPQYDCKNEEFSKQLREIVEDRFKRHPLQKTGS